jgi:FixJ family two-component response regulator
MSESVSRIYVVDDDMSVREAVESLIRSAGLSVRTFSSAQEMLAIRRNYWPKRSVAANHQANRDGSAD